MTAEVDLGATQRAIWDRIAPFWAEHREPGPTPVIEWTPPRREPDVRGRRVLELGCGDGRRAVELARAGATVLATDVSPVFVSLTATRVAREGKDVSDRVTTALVDATDPASLASLDGEFDLVVADMVLMNLVDLVPLARALPGLLGTTGRFTPMVLHPLFPSPFFVDVDSQGRPTGAASKVVGLGQRIARHVPSRVVAALAVLARPLIARPRPYLPEVTLRVAVPGQPEPHFNIHRPIGLLLKPFFEAGLVLHGLYEGADDGRPEPGFLWLDLRRVPATCAPSP